MRILLIEDDRRIYDGVIRTLGAEGFLVEHTPSGEQGWFLGSTEEFDGIVLDLNLPDIDGMRVLENWRREQVATPVLVLTVRSGWIDRVRGIELGADDYLPKPFHMEEMIARLRAIIRRDKGRASDRISSKGVVLDLGRREISFRGTAIDLAPLEFQALSHLMQNRDRPVPVHELMDNVYGVHGGRSNNALEALIKRIRRKLPVPLIRTRRGIGYVIEGGDPAGGAK